MNLTADRFPEFFQAVYGYSPFPWQVRLARHVAREEWPDCIDLPTASGKTSVIDIAVYTLACQATLSAERRTVGRRIFFTVNRRVIVDEAYDRAVRLAERLRDADRGILKEVSDALLKLAGGGLPLDVVQLRGGVYRDSSWAKALTQPTLVCTTADQLGSRLLFRGYGVSPSMQPVHAALCACDSLVLLDEAHVTKAFSQTLRLIQRYQQFKPGLRFVEMTATPSAVPQRRFGLDQDDFNNPVLRDRQVASKPAELVLLAKKKSLADELAERADKLARDDCKAVGVIVNRVQTARDVYERIKEKFPDAVHLVIGRMRPLDRDDLQLRLRSLVGPDRPAVLGSPVFVVATQALEVGADYDFDALVTECASIDALRQRFGRLNRRGRQITARACIVVTEATLKEETDAVYGQSLRPTWEWLTEGKRTTVDFGIAAFGALWEKLEHERRQQMTLTTPDAAVLLPAHLDALCQTSPAPTPSPDVSFFIHGPQRDNVEVSVCWRADLGNDPSLWPEIVSLLPPSSPECMQVPLRTVREWMLNRHGLPDADMTALATEEEDDRRADSRTVRGGPSQTVLRWRGSSDAESISNPDELRPGDTIVLPARHGEMLGHLPEQDGVIKFDLGEEAHELARRQRVIRVHPEIHPDLFDRLRKHLSGASLLTKSAIREQLGSLAEGFKSGPDEVEYPGQPCDGNPSPGVVFRFKKLLPVARGLRPDESTLDDGDDASTDSECRLSLALHAQHVLDVTERHLDRLGFSAMAPTYRAAAHHHDDGKADLRFTAMLAGISPYEAVGLPALAKSGERGLSLRERTERRERALLPVGFRHEMLSMHWVEHFFGRVISDPAIDRDLLLHLIAAHHGYARPFAPVVSDKPDDPSLLELSLDGLVLTASERSALVPAHRLDSGVAERFWDLTRRHGWWGLAYLEAVLRLADQQASALEQEGAGS